MCEFHLFFMFYLFLRAIALTKCRNIQCHNCFEAKKTGPHYPRSLFLPKISLHLSLFAAGSPEFVGGAACGCQQACVLRSRWCDDLRVVRAAVQRIQFIGYWRLSRQQNILQSRVRRCDSILFETFFSLASVNRQCSRQIQQLFSAAKIGIFQSKRSIRSQNHNTK